MATAKKPEVSAADKIQIALNDPNVPKIYFNGFQIGTSNADVLIVAQQNGRPAAVLNLSYELAKTLVSKLGLVVERIEGMVDSKFLTTDDFDSADKKKR